MRIDVGSFATYLTRDKKMSETNSFWSLSFSFLYKYAPFVNIVHGLFSGGPPYVTSVLCQLSVAKIKACPFSYQTLATSLMQTNFFITKPFLDL